MTIDAYMHVGRPRFGSAAEALATMDRWGTARAVLVLGPGVPDVGALAEAARLGGGRIRAIGVPFGETPERRLEAARLMMAAGAIGFRLQQAEPFDNPALMDELGAANGWAFATDPILTPRHSAFYLAWLARFPGARVAAPHFLRPSPDDLDREDVGALLAHDRFFPIFSRQGGVGSRQPHPHGDLLPWVERAIAACGWDRVLWGSEYPVLFWRNEQIPQARGWIRALGVQATDSEFEAFTGGNAARLFFAQPAPAAFEPAIPDWLRAYGSGPVPLSPVTGVKLPADVYAPLMSAFLAANRPEAPMAFTDFCVEQLRLRARELEARR